MKVAINKDIIKVIGDKTFRVLSNKKGVVELLNTKFNNVMKFTLTDKAEITDLGDMIVIPGEEELKVGAEITFGEDGVSTTIKSPDEVSKGAVPTKRTPGPSFANPL